MTQTITGLQLLPAYRDVSIEQVKRGRGRWYKLGDQMLPPVTSILGIIDKSGPLVLWATKVAFEAVGATMLNFGYKAMINSDDFNLWVRTVLTLGEDDAKDVREEGAKKGKEAHELIAVMLQGNDPLVPDDLAPAVRGAREFIADYGLNVVAVEHPSGTPMSSMPGRWTSWGATVMATWSWPTGSDRLASTPSTPTRSRPTPTRSRPLRVSTCPTSMRSGYPRKAVRTWVTSAARFLNATWHVGPSGLHMRSGPHIGTLRRCGKWLSDLSDIR